MKQRVLFICTHNSCRSQMAEALLRHLYGDRYEAHSAGIEPTEVNPHALRALEDRGIPTEGLASKGTDKYTDEDWDLIVTVCGGAKERCPYFPGGKRQVHRGFRDPPVLVEEEGMGPEEAFGMIRDEIEAWVREYFGGELPDVGPGGPPVKF